jgi:hypothetical protein
VARTLVANRRLAGSACGKRQRGRPLNSVVRQQPPVAIAPKPILRAGNETIYWACVYLRNAAYRETVPPKMVAELMDAIHDIAHALVNWESHHSVSYVRTHFGCFRAARWDDMPDLVAYFDAKLRGYESDAA